MFPYQDRLGVSFTAALLGGFSVMSALLLGSAGMVSGVMAICLALVGRYREGDSVLATTALSCGALGVALAVVNYVTLFYASASGMPLGR